MRQYDNKMIPFPLLAEGYAEEIIDLMFINELNNEEEEWVEEKDLN